MNASLSQTLSLGGLCSQHAVTFRAPWMGDQLGAVRCPVPTPVPHPVTLASGLF